MAVSSKGILFKQKSRGSIRHGEVAIPRNIVRYEWIKYKRNFDFIVAASGETDKTRIKNIFLARAGPDLQEVFASIPGADVAENGNEGIDPYAVAIQHLDAYFSPKQHETFERNVFWTLKPNPEETIGKFMLRCQDQASKCNFGSTAQESRAISVIDKVILFAPNDLKEQLLQKDALDIDQVAKIVSSYESVKHQAQLMNMSSSGASESFRINSDERSSINQIRFPSFNECRRCGNDKHRANDLKCPARKKECGKCKRMGHYAVKCRTPTTKRKFAEENRPGPSNRFKRYRINEIESDRERESRSFIFNINDGGELLWLKLGGVTLQLLIDSGCMKNIINEKAWEYLKNNGAKIRNQVKHCSEVFLPYGEKAKPLTVLGKFDACISIDDEGKLIEEVATFYVVLGGQQCLLGRTTAMSLGVLCIGLPSTHGINMIESTQKRPFPRIKGVQIEIPIDTSVAPVCQHPRRPPIALLSKIEEKLTSLLVSDIIEPVEGGCQWVSPLVTVVKDNGDLRLCVDMRRANQAILRERHIMPTIEDFLPRFTSAKYFSRLDIKEAFHQVELKEESRYITTFITHMGLFRYKRLMYGIVVAPEIFQRILEQVLSRCKNTVNFIDDILVFGSTEEEHDAELKVVLSILKDREILLNQEKCLFKVNSLEFLGHTISSEGIRPSNRKVEALQRFRPPITAEEVRSFLGLVTYVGRFLPNLATITAPLRELTRSGIKFVWGTKQEESFMKIKNMISNVQQLYFFDNTFRTRLIADASPVALGAVLIQFEGSSDCEPRPIAYASKSLTSTEQRYCQTEKEALALDWGVERFAVYL
ncbi:uncharacterized protein K02A2.6-like [Uranotaenia lowii]|uniref:uncharacterized protein K02A2.6-like n=1 Tax=Uranotaenia lowii TaxID=190385 RepID=UPI00247890F1|nr:uncharacterized protein K02A2.6-like [Uranotaenia lowii]